MNEKQMNTAAPNTRNTGSKTWKLGALAVAAALAMTLAPRAFAAPASEPLSRPGLSAQLGLSAAELAVINYLQDRGVTLNR